MCLNSFIFKESLVSLKNNSNSYLNWFVTKSFIQGYKKLVFNFPYLQKSLSVKAYEISNNLNLNFFIESL